MAEAETRPTKSSAVRDWIRRYPPLISFIVALLIMLVVMPSALNLPQANPTTVLEYAPVPPEDEEPPQQEGSLSTLSLGTSDTISTENTGNIGPIPPPGRGDNPIVKRCVGDPPRQTEDPNSPPCVPFFQGDNGGATFRGVTGEEVKVVLYVDSLLLTGGSRGVETQPNPGTICDIDGPPDDPDAEGCINGEGTQDSIFVDVARALARYFNDRFQTYDRHVHFYVYWSAGAGPSSRRSEAQDILERIGPYAAIDFTAFGDAQAFVEAMVKREVTIFANYAMLPNKIYRENAPYLWSFWPDVEHQVALFHDYFCKRIAPFKVRQTGNSGDVGKERQYGLLSTTDPTEPGIQMFAAQAEAKLRDGCPNGAEVDIVGEYTYARNGFETDTHPEALTTAQQNIERMRLDSVTTVIWLGGYDTVHSKAANTASWLPEWVVAGDVQNDQTEEGGGQDPAAWRYARIMSNQLREDRLAEIPCRQAVQEGDPYLPQSEELLACGIYRSFFMMFRGIQVAGPFLTPVSVDEGNHAIPRKETTTPYVASCYYDPGDFTCVKDAQESWFDPSAPDPYGRIDTRGCWRMSESGRRRIASNWDQVDAAFNSANAPCNAVSDNAVNQNPYGPAG